VHDPRQRFRRWESPRRPRHLRVRQLGRLGPNTRPEDAGTPQLPARRRRGPHRLRRALAAAFVVVLLAGGGAIAGVVLTGNHSKPQAIRLESVSSAGANPFMPSVGVDVKDVVRPAQPGGTFPADTVGLYGGSLSISSCDRQKMVTYLQQNPAKAAAWAGVLGIQPADIQGYVAELTPVILRSDTYVTNHGFVNGGATTIPAVVQAGTAVLVDAYGAPTVKCYCGNPLTPPLRYSGPVYVSPPWNYFRTDTITIVVKTTVVIDTFTLVDPATGQASLRPRGTDGRVDRPTTPTQPTIPPLMPDWYNRTYQLSCDNIADNPVPVTVRDGQGTAPPNSGYDRWDVHIETTTTGALTGLGSATAVLLYCTPQPSNFFLQEVHVLRSDGSYIGRLPHLDPLPNGLKLTPVYDQGSFTISGGLLVTSAKYYAADDSHASGPSIPATIRWRWDGRQFVPTGIPTTPAPAATTHLNISAALDWQETGVVLRGGETLRISYVSGQWSPWPGGKFDATGCLQAGCSQDPNQPENICCMAHAGLLGRISDGQPFAVGMGATIPHAGPGAVKLRINDRQLGDNSGELVIAVSVQG